VCAYPNDGIQFLHCDLFGALNSRRNLLLMLQHIIVTTDVKKTFLKCFFLFTARFTVRMVLLAPNQQCQNTKGIPNPS